MPFSLKDARKQGKLDEFAEQQRGKAEVPAPEAKSRFERLLDAMARRNSKEDAGT